jgi:hypothetical protein
MKGCARRAAWTARWARARARSRLRQCRDAGRGVVVLCTSTTSWSGPLRTPVIASGAGRARSSAPVGALQRLGQAGMSLTNRLLGVDQDGLALGFGWLATAALPSRLGENAALTAWRLRRAELGGVATVERHQLDLVVDAPENSTACGWPTGAAPGRRTSGRRRSRARRCQWRYLGLRNSGLPRSSGRSSSQIFFVPTASPSAGLRPTWRRGSPCAKAGSGTGRRRRALAARRPRSAGSRGGGAVRAGRLRRPARAAPRRRFAAQEAAGTARRSRRPHSDSSAGRATARRKGRRGAVGWSGSNTGRNPDRRRDLTNPHHACVRRTHTQFQDLASGFPPCEMRVRPQETRAAPLERVPAGRRRSSRPPGRDRNPVLREQTPPPQVEAPGSRVAARRRGAGAPSWRERCVRRGAATDRRALRRSGP